ncbi:ABC transporter permease [Nocardioides jiangxiensis]|uniref:Iron ABC transporter permease n=1 Tax=Nocardioides jiangxiensis TaxID=3064524 RepID=A0ABT9B106_9ACTN|nr:iron ABC transporter permease [Nocardioides sp. WY-20]MDO7868535.1 iron ABC transporter permease [Nocardioides sp. WY-20]
MARRHQPLSRAVGRPAALLGLAAGPLLVLGLSFLLPVGGMLSLGLWPHGSFDASGALDVLHRERTLRVLWFTLWSAAVGTAVTLLLGLPAAYVCYRLRFPGRRLLRLVLVMPFVLPTVVVGLTFDNLLADQGLLGKLGWGGTPAAIIAALVFFNLAVVVRTVGPAWEALDPRAGEAAAALGAGPVRVLRDVTLPALRPAIVSAASVVFLFCATAFGLVLVLGGLRYATVETEIYLLTTDLFDLQGAAALSILQLLVVVVLLAVAHRARATAPVERRPLAARRPHRADLPAAALTLVAAALVLLPLGALVVGSLRVDGAWSLANFRALRTVTDGAVPVTEALRTSLATALDATWMSVGLGLVIAVLVTRRSRGAAERRIRALLDGLFMLPLGVSAVTLGFGFLVTLDHPPIDLRSWPLLVPIAQALVALPLVVRTVVPVLAGIDDRQRQAAASLGAGPLRVLATIDLAVVWKPLLAAAGFAFAVSLGEFGATSFLVREDAPTLPVIIYRLLSHPGTGHYGMALAASLVLAGLTAGVLLVVERLRVPGVGGF